MRTRQSALLSGAVVVLAAAVALVAVRDGGTDRVELADPSPRPTASAVTETFDEQLDRVSRIVREVRGLDGATTPTVTVLSPGDLISRVAEDLVAYTDEDADVDRRILAALRAIPHDYDLRGELVGSLSQQVAGFYDPDSGELVVGATDPTARVGRLEELTLAHELQHALADEVHGLPPLDDDALGDDALFARRALVEGDATATMQAYAEVGFSVVDRMMLAQEAAGLQAQLAAVGTLPHVLQRSLTFPYEEGLAFVSTLRERGGWTAVDAAYAAAPTTTAQVLYPERYEAREAATTISAPTEPGGAWVAAATADLGAADLLFLFEAPGDDANAALPDPLEAASAWRGGRLDLWTDGAASAVAVAVATDRPDELCRSLGAWLTASRPGATVEETDDLVRVVEADEVATLSCGPTTRVAVAPDAATADRLVSAG